MRRSIRFGKANSVQKGVGQSKLVWALRPTYFVNFADIWFKFCHTGSYGGVGSLSGVSCAAAHIIYCLGQIVCLV